MKLQKRPRFFSLILFSFFSLVLFAASGKAGNLEIRNVRYHVDQDTKGEPSVIFDLTWKNAWRNARNYDSAWLFLKFPDDNSLSHAKIAKSGHSIIQMPSIKSPKATIDVDKNGNGFFIYPTESFRGDIQWRVRVKLDVAKLKDKFRKVKPHVFGIEMVYIPKGGFTLGDPDQKALAFGSFYRSNNKGEPNGLIEVNSESEIKVGATEGDLYYRKGQYVGDQRGTIPAIFPKGYNAFYIMKYELTQGQYATFLNSIPSGATFARVNFGGRNYFSNKGTIRLMDSRYVAEKPDRPMNYISWDDGIAFADWSALRPMTELEFTKASRGPRKPIANEFPWGTSDSNQLVRIVDTDNNLTFVNNWTEDKLDDETLAIFGASYYWVMDLSGSLWERVITIGSPDGRAFKGTHGDGQVNWNSATNEDWSQTKKNKRGHGYRGGGFYHQDGIEHEFNPYSPIAYRRFGGWSGAFPDVAYGFRCVRTAD